MFILFLLILLIVLFRVFLGLLKSSKVRHYERYEFFFCIFFYIIIILLAMFRGESVGADTSDYITDYKDMSIMTFRDILENYKGYQGYYVLSKVFSILDLPYYVWFGFVELVLVSAIARFINKYSNDKLFSILIFITTGFFMFSLAGLKQTLAMGFVFHAYIDFVEKHYLRFLALNVLAYTIHIVALLGDLIIIFYIIRNRRVYYPIFVVLLFSILFGGMYLVSSLTKIIGNDHYGSTYLNTGHSYSGTTLYFYLFVLGCTIDRKSVV